MGGAGAQGQIGERDDTGELAPSVPPRHANGLRGRRSFRERPPMAPGDPVLLV